MAARNGSRAECSRLCSLMILGLCVAPGCMYQQLQFSARRTTGALPGLQYQQVVDNLAMTAWNPDFLPYLAVAGQGSVQVTDNGTSSLSLGLMPAALATDLLGFGGSRNVTGTWSLGTVTSPEKIRGMQAVYQRAVRGRARGDPAFAWLNIGCKQEVPRGATFVGRHGKVCVWVMPEGIAGLSELTLAILNIATREDATSAPGSPVGRMQPMISPSPVPRRNFQVPPSGPVFTPGAS